MSCWCDADVLIGEMDGASDGARLQSVSYSARSSPVLGVPHG